MTAKMKLYNNKYLRRFDKQQMARLSTSKVNRARRLKAGKAKRSSGKVKRSSGKVKRSSGAKRKSRRVSPTITTMAVDPMYYAPPPMEDDDDMSSSPLTMIILFMMLAGCAVAWYFVITEMKETPAATTVSAAAGILQAKYIRAALASILTLITLVMMYKTFM